MKVTIFLEAKSLGDEAECFVHLFEACEGTSIRWLARRLQFQQVLEIRLVLRCFIWHDDMVRLPWFLVLTSLRYLLAIVAILVLGVASCSSRVKDQTTYPPGYLHSFFRHFSVLQRFIVKFGGCT